jgi:SGNH domain (fused to AT3 domains)
MNRASAFEDMLADSLGAVLRTIDARARVLIIGSVPELDQIAPDCIFRAQLYGRPRSSCAMSRTEVKKRRAESMNVLRRLTVEHPEVMLIDPIDVFCDREECRPFGGDGIYLFRREPSDPARLGAAVSELPARVPLGLRREPDTELSAWTDVVAWSIRRRANRSQRGLAA